MVDNAAMNAWLRLRRGPSCEPLPETAEAINTLIRRSSAAAPSEAPQPDEAA
jgi:hypothetical protein